LLHLFVRLNEPSIQSMYLLNGKGILVADTVANPSVLGEDCSWRDYYRGAMAKKGARGRAAVHVSRVRRGGDDGCGKFAISTLVYRGPEQDSHVLGVVVANFATNDRLGDLQLTDDRRTAVLVGPKDPSTDESAPLFYSKEPRDSKPDEYLVMVH